MTVEIKITGVDAADALNGLRGLAEALAPMDTPSRAIGVERGVEAGKTPEAPTASLSRDDDGWGPVAPQTPPDPAKRGRGRPAKQAKPTEPAPTVPPVAGDPPAQDTVAAPKQPDPAPAVLLDFAEFRKQLMAMAPIEDNEKSEKAIAVINAAGYAKLKEVKPEDFASILAKVAEAVGA